MSLTLSPPPEFAWELRWPAPSNLDIPHPLSSSLIYLNTWAFTLIMILAARDLDCLPRTILRLRKTKWRWLNWDYTLAFIVFMGMYISRLHQYKNKKLQEAVNRGLKWLSWGWGLAVSASFSHSACLAALQPKPAEARGGKNILRVFLFFCAFNVYKPFSADWTAKLTSATYEQSDASSSPSFSASSWSILLVSERVFFFCQSAAGLNLLSLHSSSSWLVPWRCNLSWGCG